MAGSKKPKLRNSANDFNLICKLARGGYDAALRRFLRRHATIALSHHLITPVMQMAIEGNDKAVWMLMNEFGASIHQAVTGYARVGRHDQVERLLKLGADMNAAANGYAFSGQHDKAAEFLQRGAEAQSVARGYSFSGHYPTEEIFKLLLAVETNHADTYEKMLEGYAYAGDKKLVEKIIADGVDIDYAVQGYAWAGRVHEVEDLLARGANINHAVYGYARGGYVLRVKNALTRGASMTMAMEGYASAGMLDKIRDLYLQEVPIVYAMRSMARVGVLRFVEYIYKETGDLINATLGFHDAGYFANETILLRLLSHLHNSNLRRSMAYAAQEYIKELDCYGLINKAWRINKIMHEYDLNYDQALVLQTPGLRAWLLQGNQTEPKLPRDMHIEIAAMLANISHLDMDVIANSVVKNTLEGAKTRINAKHHPGFFGRVFSCSYDKKTANKRERDDLQELQMRYHQSQRRGAPL